MDPQPLSKIAQLSGAAFIAGNPNVLVESISQNTRTIEKGGLYIALKGDRFDGHQFIGEAVARGAVGVLCEGSIPEGLPEAFGVLKVTNTHAALQEMASQWRKLLPLKVLMITGSSGKTTTKDFAKAILSEERKVTATEGNFNNDIGLPLSMLRASMLDEAAVWEIGMNHRGEIAPLAALGQPDIAIITNIGTAHIGFLGSQENIAEEKGDLLAALSSSGVAILPAADSFCDYLKGRTSARVVRVGLDLGEIQARALRPTFSGTHFEVHYQGNSYPAFLPVVGSHMVINALLALAAGLEYGISLEKGIEGLKKIHSSQSRLSLEYCHGITLIDDTYNANPDSMEAALTTVASLASSGRRIAVLGCMGELGDYAAAGYHRVGTKAASSVDLLIVVGSEATPMALAARKASLPHVIEVANNEEASALLLTLVQQGDVVLVKGSAVAHLKEVVTALKAKQ